MKKYVIAAYLSFVAFLFLATGFAGSRVAAFDPFRVNQDPTVCSQTDAKGNPSPVCTVNGATNPITGTDGVITKIANIFALITGIAAIVAIMVGGFEYVRSGGESAKVNKAKNTIMFAIIGLVVVVLARAVVALAVSKL